MLFTKTSNVVTTPPPTHTQVTHGVLHNLIQATSIFTKLNGKPQVCPVHKQDEPNDPT